MVMASFIIIIIYLLPIRLALRHRPPAVVVVVQIPVLPQAPMTLEQEWELVQARDGAR
jgi:hypothetical protein